MSLSLDLGLFLRNSKSKLNLSLTHRGVLFALAIRIGNNSSTWISQATLAHEVGIDEKNLQDHLKKIRKSGLILITKQISDRRKNEYKFVKNLTNYHQMTEIEKKELHELLGDEFCPLPAKLSTSKKKLGAKSPCNSVDRGRNHPLNRGRNHPLSSSENPPEIQIKQEHTDQAKTPKVTVQSNTYKPVTVAIPLELIDKFYPGAENQKLCDQVARNCGTSGMWLIHKFKELTRKSRPMERDLDKLFRSFLDRELPSRKILSQPKQAAKYF